MSKRLLFSFLAVGVILCGIASPSFAADASTPVQTLGWYVNSAEGPDAMTATASAPIAAQGGEVASDNPEDVVVVSNISGATVTFAGRSADSGCFYTTWGRYLGGSGGSGGGGDNYWLAFFDNQAPPDAYLTAYVTRPSSSENGLIFVGEQSYVVVELHSAAPGRTYSFSLRWESDDGAQVVLSNDEQPISEGTPVVMPIFGVEPGTAVIIKDGKVVAKAGDPPASMPASQPTTAPVRARDNYGSVTIPFTANVSKDKIKQALNELLGDELQSDVDKLRKMIVDQVKALSEATKGKVPWPLKDEQVQALLTEAQNKINGLGDELKKQIAAKIDAQAAKIKDKLDKVSPKLRVSGHYYAADGQWTDLKVITVDGLESLKVEGSVGLEASVDLSAVIAGVSIPVGITVNLTAETVFSGEEPPTLADPTATTTEVTVTPIVKTTISGSIAGKAGLTWSIGAAGTVNTTVTAVSGTLVRGQSN